MGKFSKDKGKRGELEFAHECQANGIRAYRGAQVAGKACNGTDQAAPDVITPEIPVSWEVKRTEALSIYKAMEQCVADAEEGDLPIVSHRRNGEEWLCILRASDLLPLLKNYFIGQPIE